MIIAVTDACVFIEIHDLGLTEHFFALPCEMHTTVDVVNEVLDEQAQILFAFQQCSKLKIHSIEEWERREVLCTSFPKALSENDKTVLYLAGKLNAIVLSSDKAVRNYAKKQGLDYHGIVWVVDQMVECLILNPREAATKMERLLMKNLFYQNNLELILEMKKRIRLWQ
jgi:rRNA maturation endonuclease Nob1